MENNLPINPYEVLQVSPAASDAEITKAFALAMKRRLYPPDVIAKARKSLMNSQERILADYLRPILTPVTRFKRQYFSVLEGAKPILDLLSEYDSLDETIAEIQQTYNLDQRLALKLFHSSSISSKPLEETANNTPLLIQEKIGEIPFDEDSLKKANSTSQNFSDISHSINKIYQEILGREVDPDGLQTYSKCLANGWSLQQIREDIAKSSESQLKQAAQINSKKKENNSFKLFF